MSTITEGTTLDDIDAGLRWATAGGVRVQTYIDRLLDERLQLMASDEQVVR